MKINIQHLGYGILLSAMTIITVGCDDIKEQDRFIYAGEVTAERAVLLEDFTGQNCLNCPKAHEEIKKLEEQFGRDKVIAVSIHSGGFGISEDYSDFPTNSVFLMTKEGQTIMDSYGIKSWPMGVVDLGSPITYDLWATQVREEISKPTDITITLSAEYEADPRDGESGLFGNINITADVISSTDHSCNLQFWITENNIVAMQNDNNNYIMDYVHDNVFRAQVFPGLRGTEITLTGGVNLQQKGSIPVKWNEHVRWNPANMEVVAFVSDSKGALQASRCQVLVKANN